MKAVEALPVDDAFPAPHKADCAKLRKNNDRFAYIQASRSDRFVDLSTRLDAPLAWRPKLFARRQRHAIARGRIAGSKRAKTIAGLPLLPRMHPDDGR